VQVKRKLTMSLRLIKAARDNLKSIVDYIKVNIKSQAMTHTMNTLIRVKNLRVESESGTISLDKN
jgi:hypothetical protein